MKKISFKSIADKCKTDKKTRNTVICGGVGAVVVIAAAVVIPVTLHGSIPVEPEAVQAAVSDEATTNEATTLAAETTAPETTAAEATTQEETTASTTAAAAQSTSTEKSTSKNSGSSTSGSSEKGSASSSGSGSSSSKANSGSSGSSGNSEGSNGNSENTQTQPPKAGASDCKAVADRVVYYINSYRSSPATQLGGGLTAYAEYRSRQLITNFAHDVDDMRAAATDLKYGRYIDDPIYLTPGQSPYYDVNAREAIGMGGWFGSVDQVAEQIATGFKNSSGHWAYVGSAEYPYIAVGVSYSKGMWYCSVEMARIDLNAEYAR